MLRRSPLTRSERGISSSIAASHAVALLALPPVANKRAGTRRAIIALGCILALVFSACGRSSMTPIGDRRYEPLLESEDVLVFTADRDVDRPFRVIGLLTYNNPGKYQILTLESAIPDLKEQARAAGADGIIIDQ